MTSDTQLFLNSLPQWMKDKADAYVDPPKGYGRRNYYQSYVKWMRSAKLALDHGDIEKANYRVMTALCNKRCAKTEK